MKVNLKENKMNNTEKKSEQTVGKWTTWTNDSGINGFGDPKKPVGRAFNDADAKFIVTACNSHNQIVESLKEVTGLLQILVDSGEAYNMILGNAKSALRSAGVEV